MKPFRGGTPEGGGLIISRRARSRKVGPPVTVGLVAVAVDLLESGGLASTGGLLGIFAGLTGGVGVESPVRLAS